MKQYPPPVIPASPSLGSKILMVLTMLLLVALQGPVHCGDLFPVIVSIPESCPSLSWRGSASMDSSQGSSFHLRVSDADLAFALSMVHETAGTADFPGLGGEALEGLSIFMNFDSPFLVAGDLGLAGLSRFLFRPAGAGPLLAVHGRKPLRTERPDGSRYRGLVLGKDAGLMAIHPLSDPSRITSGAWFSPAASPLSLMVLAGSEPGRRYDGWYESERIQADRLWGAVSLGGARKGKLHRLSLSGALAGSAGIPGTDAMAARLEAMVSIKRFRLDAEASLASGNWRAPDGSTAVPVRIDLSAIYRRRGLELSGGYRLVLKRFADDEPETVTRGHVLLGSASRQLRLSSTLSQATGQSLPGFSLDTRWKPGLFPVLLPGLVFETSWKTKDGLAERFDTEASLKGGAKLRWSMNAGLRHDTRGRHAKGSASVLAPFGSGSLRLGLKSDGWLPLEGDLPDFPLVLSVTWGFVGP